MRVPPSERHSRPFAGIPFEFEKVDYKTLVERRGESGASDAVPLGSLPVVSIDGKVYCQSGALARWTGAQGANKLYPVDGSPTDLLLVDEVFETCADAMASCPQDADEQRKKAAREAYADKKSGKLHKFLSLVEKRLGEHAGDFVLGAKLSLADLAVVASFDGILAGGWDFIDKSNLDGYPRVLACIKAVKAHELVKEDFA